MSLRSLVHWFLRFLLRRESAIDIHPSENVPKQPWRPRPIRSWVLLVVFGLILIGGWCYYELQMTEIESLRTAGDTQADLEIAKMRLDTVRATLTVAAGIGAASALVLSFRRQQHDEYHSTQQRITELRMQAVEQLSSSDYTIKRSGLSNLERLGAQHEELRQQVLDEICSYLRSPFDAEASSTSDPEREVRALALEILQRRLNRRLGSRDYWSHTRLNLEGAVLTSVDFSDCRLQNSDFTGARFRSDADFHRASFEGQTRFSRAEFEGSAEFSRVSFGGEANFEEAMFRSDAAFRRATFNGTASFERSMVAEEIDCSLAEFQRLLLTEAIVAGDAIFEGTVFHSYSGFALTVFRNRADFELARFEGPATFKEAEFSGEVGFMDVGFDWVDFERSAFLSDAVFDQSMFQGHTVFREAAFMARASFREVHFHEAVEFERSAFLRDVLLSGARFRKLLCDQSLPGNYRAVEPRGRKFLHHWTVRQHDGSEPSAPHLAFGELGL
jgi:uncharacterized protein YjbI with pentapeptide repeats